MRMKWTEQYKDEQWAEWMANMREGNPEFWKGVMALMLLSGAFG